MVVLVKNYNALAFLGLDCGVLEDLDDVVFADLVELVFVLVDQGGVEGQYHTRGLLALEVDGKHNTHPRFASAGCQSEQNRFFCFGKHKSGVHAQNRAVSVDTARV